LGRRSVLAAAGGFLSSPAIVRAEGQAGVALVIGNSKYKWEASLPNVQRDAPDVAKRFQALGLKTELLQDARQDAMRAALDKFAAAARGANLAAFYFAGHGALWEKDTYLVPQDADLNNPATVQSLLPVRFISAAMKEAQHRLLVFDNCRNNPADGWRQRAAIDSSSINQAELAAAALNGPNTLVLFSTAPGRVAVDGPAGENSPFAASLLRQLAEPSVDLQALPAKLRRELLMATEGRQVLWDQSTFDQPFLLANRGTSIADSAARQSSSQIIELPNAYAFAREKNLLLPPGLIAFRASHASPHASKIGAFKYTHKTSVGTTGTAIEPALALVISVTHSTAEMVTAAKDFLMRSQLRNGEFWKFSSAALSGDQAVWEDMEWGSRIEMKWREANSGLISRHPTGSGVSALMYSSTFTRLD
jgi:hypothetical protein